jgi:hypothetical protein
MINIIKIIVGFSVAARLNALGSDVAVKPNTFRS